MVKTGLDFRKREISLSIIKTSIGARCPQARISQNSWKINCSVLQGVYLWCRLGEHQRRGQLMGAHHSALSAARAAASGCKTHSKGTVQNTPGGSSPEGTTPRRHDQASNTPALASLCGALQNVPKQKPAVLGQCQSDSTAVVQL